jgi:hypothetical protein
MRYGGRRGYWVAVMKVSLNGFTIIPITGCSISDGGTLKHMNRTGPAFRSIYIEPIAR